MKTPIIGILLLSFTQPTFAEDQKCSLNINHKIFETIVIIDDEVKLEMALE